MSKLEEAKIILNALHVPAKQQNAMCCCALLAMAGLLEDTAWANKLAAFLQDHDSLVQIYTSKRTMRKMPVKINGEDFTFSPGKHNQLQKAIIEEFAPRFAPNSECLYVGDTTEKDLVKKWTSCKTWALRSRSTIKCRMLCSIPQKRTGCILLNP